MRGQGAVADDVDIDLVELAEAALLGALAPPDLLDLVALEGEVQDPGVVQDVAGEGDGQVEVEAEPPRRVRLGGTGGKRGLWICRYFDKICVQGKR